MRQDLRRRNSICPNRSNAPQRHKQYDRGVQPHLSRDRRAFRCRPARHHGLKYERASDRVGNREHCGKREKKGLCKLIHLRAAPYGQVNLAVDCERPRAPLKKSDTGMSRNRIRRYSAAFRTRPNPQDDDEISLGIASILERRSPVLARGRWTADKPQDRQAHKYRLAMHPYAVPIATRGREAPGRGNHHRGHAR